MSNIAIALCCIVISNALTQAGGITYSVPAPTENICENPAVTENFESQQQAMIDCINNERENTNLPPVYTNSALSEVAQVRLQEIMVSFSHERPDGSTKAELLADAGVSPSNYMSENIISGTVESTPESLMKSFMASSVHRAWILSKEVNAVCGNRQKRIQSNICGSDIRLFLNRICKPSKREVISTISRFIFQ